MDPLLVLDWVLSNLPRIATILIITFLITRVSRAIYFHFSDNHQDKQEKPMPRAEVTTKIVLEIELPAMPLGDAVEKANEILEDIESSDGMPSRARLVGAGVEIALTDD